MSTSDKQREFIKKYETILPLIKRVFYYGTLSSSDLDMEGICKSSKYSDNKKTLEYTFGGILEENKNEKGKNSLRIRTDHFESPDDAFLRLFSLRSFGSMQKLFFVLFSLTLLSSRDRITVNDMIHSKYFLNQDDPKSNIRTIQRMLREMADFGILIKYKGGYSFPNDMKINYNRDDVMYSIVMEKALRKREKQERTLVQLADICTGIYPLSICGNAVRHKLDLSYVSPFIVKHRHLGQTFNDELVWKLIQNIERKQSICIQTKKNTLKDMLPYRIITDSTTGRQYLFAVYIGEMPYPEYLLIRLDRIKSVAAEKNNYPLPSDESLSEKYQTAFRYSFTGTTYLQRNEEPQQGILEYDNGSEWIVRAKFPDMTPELIDENRSRIRIMVNSLTELKPWLRSNMEHIRLVESTDGSVQEFEDEMTEWREMYGIK